MLTYNAVVFHLFQIAERCQGEDYSQSRPSDYNDSAKRFCEPNAVRAVTSSTNGGSRTLPYPHSMPTSPTMFERGNEARLVFFYQKSPFKSPNSSKKVL